MNHIWLRNGPAKLMWNHNKYLATDIMLGISCAVWSDNLQETAMILSNYHFITHIFHCDAWRNLWSSALVIRVTWQSKQMALMSAKMVSYSCFYWTKNDCSWFTKVCSRCKCNMSHIRLKLMRCHWSCNPRRVKISRHSDHVGLLHTLSTIDAQSKLVLGGLAKLNIWGHSSMGFQKSYNKVASCIRELTANMFLFPLKNFTSEGLI